MGYQYHHMYDLIQSSFCVRIRLGISTHLNNKQKIIQYFKKTFCCRTVPGEHPNIDILPLKNCGSTIQDNIARGNKTNINQFQWMAIMQYDSCKFTKKNLTNLEIFYLKLHSCGYNTKLWWKFNFQQICFNSCSLYSTARTYNVCQTILKLNFLY